MRQKKNFKNVLNVLNDYVLTEIYVQQYIRERITKPRTDLDIVHCIIIISLNSFMTRKACKRQKQKAKTKPLDFKSLQSTKTKRDLLNAVENHLQN